MKFFLTFIAGAVLSSLSAPVSAAVLTATYQGVVYGFDGAGLFGSANNTLTNLPYTAVYTYDTSASVQTTGPFASYLYGSEVANLTINGHSVSLTNTSGNLTRSHDMSDAQSAADDDVRDNSINRM